MSNNKTKKYTKRIKKNITPKTSSNYSSIQSLSTLEDEDINSYSPVVSNIEDFPNRLYVADVTNEITKFNKKLYDLAETEEDEDQDFEPENEEKQRTYMLIIKFPNETLYKKMLKEFKYDTKLMNKIMLDYYDEKPYLYNQDNKKHIIKIYYEPNDIIINLNIYAYYKYLKDLFEKYGYKGLNLHLLTRWKGDKNRYNFMEYLPNNQILGGFFSIPRGKNKYKTSKIKLRDVYKAVDTIRERGKNRALITPELYKWIWNWPILNDDYEDEDEEIKGYKLKGGKYTRKLINRHKKK